MPDAPGRIAGWHAHVYFDEETIDRARDLCERARDAFGLPMGRMHQRPVGPHPMWSCQLSVPPAAFGDVVAWLTLNRGGLSVFVHPETGNDLADHTDHAIWLGEARTLDTAMFDPDPPP